jgi:NAD(P)-dependent dehydrogenase (short-subunit alcohol dehydrogenase family)
MTSIPTKTVIVTGGNTGLGFQCARFVGVGVDPDVLVVIACRTADAGRQAQTRLEAMGVHAITLPLDLASLASVRAFVDHFRGSGLPPLVGLVCNAGVQNAGPAQRTVDGYESTFAINHLGHFLLVNLLLPLMAADSQIIFVSSGVHDPAEKTGLPAPVFTSTQAVANDVEEQGIPAGQRRYTTSKLCNLYCTYELARRLQASNDPRLQSICVNAFDPGMMPGTGLTRNYPAPIRFAWNYVLPVLRLFKRNVHSTVTSGRRLAALAMPGANRPNGQYFSDGRETRSSPLSYDQGNARELWETSALYVGTGNDIA